MKSAKEESTGYTDTSFMKPSLIYFDLLVKTGAETPQKQENATL